MAASYILGRIGVQIGALLLGVFLYSPWAKQTGIMAEHASMNAFIYTFLAASILPIWRRNITLKVRLAVLVVGAIVAVLFGSIYLAIINNGPYANPRNVAVYYGILVAIVGPAFGWLSSSGSIRLMSKRTTAHSGVLERQQHDVASLASSNEVQPAHIVVSMEIIVFRFLLLTWGVALLIFAFATYSQYESVDAQQRVEQVARDTNNCSQMQNKSSVDDYSAAICSYISSPSYTQGAQREVDLWEDRAANLFYLAVAVLVFSSLLFYGIRSGVTGRLRPLWLLQQQRIHTPKTGNDS